MINIPHNDKKLPTFVGSAWKIFRFVFRSSSKLCFFPPMVVPSAVGLIFLRTLGWNRQVYFSAITFLFETGSEM